MIYLDHAATTPMSQTALDVYTETATRFFGNTQSLHQVGVEAAALLAHCRKQIAYFLNGEATGVIFTSGGTESNQLALETLLSSSTRKGKHIISTEIEHPSILNYLEKLKKDGYEITLLPVDDKGLISLIDLKQALVEETSLVTIQFVNSEIGTIQKIQEIGTLLSEQDILFHSDCVQAFGKIPIDVVACKLDGVSISSHKLYGPLGTGACYLNPHLNRRATLSGGTHEMGLRPGTVSLPAIAAFTAASSDILQIKKTEFQRITALRNYFFEKLDPRVTIINSNENSLPHIIPLLLPNIEGQYAMISCSKQRIMIATGSACSIGRQKPSHVIKALGKSDAEAKTFIRISLGRHTTQEDLEKVAVVLNKLLQRYRRNF